MSASGQTHAEAIGLTGYATDASGIGGLVKTRVEDFRVEELSTKLSMDQRGRFTVARITLRNWETNRFIARLAKALGIPKERIFFAGTKDKRAITRQLFVIDAPANKVSGVDMTDVDIEVLGRPSENRLRQSPRQPVHDYGARLRTRTESNERRGSHGRNRAHSRHARTDLGAERFPNWIGPQRFGSGRPVTAEVGRHVIAGRFEDAVMAYLSMPEREKRLTWPPSVRACERRASPRRSSRRVRTGWTSSAAWPRTCSRNPTTTSGHSAACRTTSN